MKPSVLKELRMLREIARHLLEGETCRFCGELIMPDAAAEGFGHRDHSPIHVEITVHHNDNNHENNLKDNRKLSHSSCHRAHHAHYRV
jgi:hypothetical protein